MRLGAVYPAAEPEQHLRGDLINACKITESISPVDKSCRVAGASLSGAQQQDRGHQAQSGTQEVLSEHEGEPLYCDGGRAIDQAAQALGQAA